jgi:hypothetical protein
MDRVGVARCPFRPAFPSNVATAGRSDVTGAADRTPFR